MLRSFLFSLKLLNLNVQLTSGANERIRSITVQVAPLVFETVNGNLIDQGDASSVISWLARAPEGSGNTCTCSKMKKISPTLLLNKI